VTLIFHSTQPCAFVQEQLHVAVLAAGCRHTINIMSLETR